MAKHWKSNGHRPANGQTVHHHYSETLEQVFLRQCAPLERIYAQATALGRSLIPITPRAAVSAPCTVAAVDEMARTIRHNLAARCRLEQARNDARHVKAVRAWRRASRMPIRNSVGDAWRSL